MNDAIAGGLSKGNCSKRFEGVCEASPTFNATFCIL
jgi:hypothetical protein